MEKSESSDESDSNDEVTLNQTFYKPTFFHTKAIIVGEASTGKTNIIERLVHNRFDPARVATIRYDISRTWLEVGKVGSSLIADIAIWDTAGQEKYRTLSNTFYRDCAICLIVYDITDRSTLETARWWYNECQRLNPPCISDFSPHNVALIGNKLDLDHLREISTEEGQAFAKQLGIPLFIEQSSITRQECNGLDYLLSHMVANTLKRHREIEKRKAAERGMVSIPLEGSRPQAGAVIKLHDAPKLLEPSQAEDSCNC